MSDDQTKPTESNEATPEAPPMNRAERRAAAKGKKAPSTAGSHGFGGGNAAGSAHSNAPGGVRLPRTGHKGG